MWKTAEKQISSSQCFFILSLLSFAVLVSSIVFICFPSFGLFPFLATISILLFSTVFVVTFSKQKVITGKNPTQDEEGSMSTPNNNLLENEVEEQKLSAELEAVTFNNSAQQSEVSDIHEYQVESTDFPSASESSDDFSASDNFELNWMSFNNVGKNVAISECSISSSDDDEDDNLIEISFPDNNSSELNEESEEKLQTELPEYFPESIFRQEGLMELLAEISEVNEEENLIEIDLSVGSIKGSGYTD
ncbi:uncharacterized protein LOC8286842 [Ricinus communis]|uniref:Transmembrane protein n=1 Tax=Ricinus communis TaxID=3988 RepID=B9S9T8_RICCO|nr:uncharacterized protein LOC8286842 [Ricinus communis]EEF39608.1 conserved hypothetical protein [Ricinus communis]|eukprot:XP_002522757.1 uncharacterized protein LOC8286842 [Ricinus communis]